MCCLCYIYYRNNNMFLVKKKGILFMDSKSNIELKENLNVLLYSLNVYKNKPDSETRAKIIVCLCKAVSSAKSEEDFENIRKFLENSRKYEYINNEFLDLLINFSQSSNLNKAREILDYREKNKTSDKNVFIKEFTRLNNEYKELNNRMHQLEDFKNLYRNILDLIDFMSNISELNSDEMKKYKGSLEKMLNFLMKIVSKLEYIALLDNSLNIYSESFYDNTELETFKIKIYNFESELNEIVEYVDIATYNKYISDIDDCKTKLNNLSNVGLNM